MSEIPVPPTQPGFVDGLKPLAKPVGIVAGIFVVGALLGWVGRGVIAGTPDVPTMLAFNDWRVTCPASKEKNVACRLGYDMVDQKSGQQVASFTIFREPGKDEKSAPGAKMLAINVPLNVLLEPGLGLKLGSDTKTIPYKTCVDGGCIATLPLDKALEKSIGDTDDISLTVARLDGKGVELPVSTKGFAAAHKAYVNYEAKRSSWWWRLWS